MANGKRSEQKQRILWKLNWKKNEYTYGNNISRIYSENLRKLHMKQSQKFLLNN